MASVRLTQELKSGVINAIDRKFRTMLDMYTYPQELQDKLVNKYEARVMAAIRRHSDLQVRLKDTIQTALPEEVAAANWIDGTESGERTLFNVATSTGRQPDYSRHLYVHVTNAEGERVSIYSYVWHRPTNWGKEMRVLPWEYETAVSDCGFSDPELQLLAMPIYTKRTEIAQKKTAMMAHAKKVLDGCSTLKQLLTVWPAARDLIPQHALERMEQKVVRNDTPNRFNPAALSNPDMNAELQEVSNISAAMDALKD